VDGSQGKLKIEKRGNEKASFNGQKEFACLFGR
jgi:hypothetical protein